MIDIRMIPCDAPASTTNITKAISQRVHVAVRCDAPDCEASIMVASGPMRVDALATLTSSQGLSAILGPHGWQLARRLYMVDGNRYRQLGAELIFCGECADENPSPLSTLPDWSRRL